GDDAGDLHVLVEGAGIGEPFVCRHTEIGEVVEDVVVVLEAHVRPPEVLEESPSVPGPDEGGYCRAGPYARAHVVEEGIVHVEDDRFRWSGIWSHRSTLISYREHIKAAAAGLVPHHCAIVRREAADEE